MPAFILELLSIREDMLANGFFAWAEDVELTLLVEWEITQRWLQ